MSITAISQLSKDIANSVASNVGEQRVLYNQLVKASSNLKDNSRPEVEFLLDAATDISRYLADGNLPTPEALLTLVTRLVVNAECSYFRNLGTQAAASKSEGTKTLALENVRAIAPTIEPLKAQGSLTIAKMKDASQEPQDLNRMRLGQLLVQLGFAKSAHIQDALAMQGKEGIRIGEALSRLGHLDPHDLRDALGLQSNMRKYAAGSQDRLASEPAKLEFQEWHESILGEVLLTTGAVSESELNGALSIQKATGMRIGEVLVQNGVCDWATIRSAIRLQEKLRHGEQPTELKLSPKGIFNEKK